MSRSAPYPVSRLQQLRETELRKKREKRKSEARRTGYTALCSPLSATQLYENRDSGGTSRSALLRLSLARAVEFSCGLEKVVSPPRRLTRRCFRFCFPSRYYAHVIFPARHDRQVPRITFANSLMRDAPRPPPQT